MSSNVNHGEEDGLEDFSEIGGTEGADSICEPWTSSLSSEDSSAIGVSTTRVDVLGSYVFVAMKRLEISAY